MTVWSYPGSKLAAIVDGDTFDAYVSRVFDFGFHITLPPVAKQRFRLNRCNAAPSSTDSGKGAKARLAQLLAPGFDLDSVGPYKFRDEWMAEVTMPDGRNVTDVLIAEQWAAPWDGNGTAPLPPWPRTV